MILLIVLPFIVLILVVLVLSMMRGIRRAGEIRLNQSPLTVPTDHRKPSEVFLDKTWLPMCAQVADVASSRLNRPLTQNERRAIWRSRTALVLEILLKEVQETSDPEVVVSLLASLPPGMDRPDSTGWCAYVSRTPDPNA